MKIINITTMKHIVYILSIACLLVLSTTQAQAVRYKPYTSTSCANQRYDAAAAPIIGFSSTSAYATDDWTNPTTPMLNADGSINSEGTTIVSGPRRNTGNPGTPGPGGNNQQPVGDAILPLLLMAAAFCLTRYRTRSYRTATSAYRTGRALQNAELQDGDKRLQDGQSPTEIREIAELT